ncbi:complement factor B-like isoform X2 [Periophthalmus magnuspinnatus]|uniref:complement factor B-like isoform X2 n=1 Tax=Periophthalmus magnuspinnatus TaxID=409849 RepID=UPI00243661D3|nr:complement factor B-like isoform X2 [Periophthalmus magnuspinnatus]
MSFFIHQTWFVAVFWFLIKGDVVWCNCSMNGMEIEGANFSLSNGLNEGSILQYQCPTGYYAYPELAYRCQLNHRWTPEPQSRLRCRRVECPDPTVLQNGYTLPINENKRYYYESKITYHCYTGYTLHGPFRRKCLENGKWSGSNPVCRQDSGDCADPGVPPGGMRFGNSFEIGDKVNFKCRSNMILIGSEQRECQVDGQWSGTETSCYYKYTYDSPWEVTGEFGRGIRNTLTSEFVDGTQKGLSITLSRNGTLNIFIALDVSESIDDDSFQSAKDAIKTLIKKIEVFSVYPNYEVIFFSSKIHTAINILDFYGSNNPPPMKTLLEKVETYKIEETDRFGTNLNAVFERILEKMAAIKIRDSRFSEHKHVIILFTDGGYNTGGAPTKTVEYIKSLVYMDQLKNRLGHLDIYVFGIGAQIQDDILKPLAIGEGKSHYYKLKKVTDLQKTFDEIIEVQAIHIHPNFNISAKVNQGVKEFYDYDVALIELVEDAPITISLRPICIPCTVETNTALRQNLTCKEQENFLLKNQAEVTFLTKKNFGKKVAHLKLDADRHNCIMQAKNHPNITEAHVPVVATENFLCTGGRHPYLDQVACKGDSGGAVFKNYESRTFQVALVSWGSKQMRNCKNNRPVHSDDESRDFHINLFKVVPFLKSILGNTEKYFVPLLFVD